jgi:hypothetical protein
LDGEARFPVYAVFEAIAGFAGADVIETSASDDSKVSALLLASGGKRRMLVANKTASAVEAELPPGGRPVSLPGYAVEVVDWTE